MSKKTNLEKFLTLLIFLFCWGSFILPVIGENTLIIPRQISGSKSLNTYTEFYIDSTFTETITDISSKKFHSFNRLNIQGHPYTTANKNYWLRFQIENRLAFPHEKIWFSCGMFDDIEIYIWQKEEMLLVGKGGRLFKGVSRKYTDYPWSFPLKIDAGQKVTFYVKCFDFFRTKAEVNPILSNHSSQLLNQWQEDKKKESYKLLTIIFLGICLFMSLFTILQYLQTRQLAYLLYFLYLVCIFLYFLRSLEANTNLLLFFSFFPGLVLKSEPFIHFLAIITYIFFVAEFLNFRQKSPKVFIAVYLLVIINVLKLITAAIYIIFSLPLNSVAIFGHYLFTFLSYAVLFHIVYIIFDLKNLLSLFIIFGTFFVFAGSISNILINFFSTEATSNLLTTPQTYTQLGILAEILCFSLGLGYRNKLIQENLKASEFERIHLEELNQTKSKFYTNITHEFRTPLTVIKGMSEQIANENIKNLIQRNSQRLLNMVNQLLDLSKLESNKLAVEWVQGDVISFLNYLTESYHSFASNKNINLAFFSNKSVLKMDYDPEKLQQILSNLISNAIKFTPQYGTIKVITSLFSKNGQDCLKIIVKDTGNGIPQEKLPQIFNRFYQVDDSNTRKGEGSGIGLALAKELVQLMEGKIEVESELGIGSEFSVYLPIHQNASKQREDQPFSSEPILVTSPTSLIKSETQPSNLNSEKPLILVIEDNADVVEYIITCLQGKYEYQAASNGKIGVSKALEIIPDVILCDVMMPEMDGFEVCEQLKNAKATSHIPIIMLTAKATHEDKIVGLEQGADAYLTKPFDKKELLVRIKNLVALSQRFREKLLYSNRSTYEKTAKAVKETAFLEELKEIIQNNLENELFNTQYLCKEIAMSRTQLHRKLKALTNVSTANYIRNYRLQKAKILLETTDLPIGEVAFQVGFKDFSHFSKSFFKMFGQKPSGIRP